MSDKLGNDFVHYTADGLFFYESSSVVTPSTSQSAQPQITQITCSADFENNIASIGSLSGYFVVPLIGGFPKGIEEMSVGEDFAVASIQTSLIPSQLNVVYNTGSFFAVSSSNTNFYHQPTSSEDIINYILNVSIEKNDSPNLVALKTYNAITGSIIYRGATDSEGDSIGFNYISASLTGSAITIFNTFSQSINSVFISGGANLGGIGDFTVGENFTVGYSPFVSNIIQSGSYGSGSFTNFEAPRGTLDVQSSSLVIGRDVEDTTQSSFIFRVQSGSFGGTEHRDILYISASEGKLGLGTTDPLTDVDIRANDFQIQRKTERRGLKINNEGNIESFSSDVASATTGSEFLLRYSRGIEITPTFMATFVGLSGDATGSNDANAVTLFNALKPDVQVRALTAAEKGGKIRPPSTGDTLGQIRWITDSGSLTGLNSRVAGETAVIKAVVSDVDTSGVRADLIFSVASKTAGAIQKFLIDANNNHQMTGSLEVSDDLVVKDDVNITDDLTVGGDITANGNIIGDGATQLSGLTHITAIGNTAFGNHVSDTHTFTGHITASGNISASGTILANTYTVGGLSALSNFNGDLDVGKDTIDTTYSSPNNNFIGHITASGNISASGNVIASNVFLPGGGKISFDDSLDGSDQNITGTDSNITIDGDDKIKLRADTVIEIQNTSQANTIVFNPNAGHITASGAISASGTIYAFGFDAAEGNINNVGILRTDTIRSNTSTAVGLTIVPNITSSGNISSSGTIITEDLQVDTITNQTTGGGIILDSAGFIGLDSSGGDIRFRDAGTNQLHFDMDGTDGAQVISPSVAGDDIIFKNQGGDSVLTLKSEGQTEIHGNITASGNISASGTVTADDLHLPSTSPSTTSNLLYVSSSTAITGSRSANNLMYSGSMIGTGTGIIHIMHGSYKKVTAHTTRTYISFGTGDKENTAAGNGYVRYHPPYGGKIRKFTAAGSLGGSKIGVVTFEFYINGSIVSAATCTATVNPQDTMVDIDFNDAAIFDKGDKVQIALTSAAADGTDYWIYWNSVFEFNVD